MNRIAKVAVDLSLDREFDYLIPDELQSAVEIGSRVEVPFGKRHVNGFVVGLADDSDFEKLKPIGKVLGEKSLITEPVMELARWMSSYYLAPFETCVRSVLPAVVRRKARGEKKQLVVSLVEEASSLWPLTPKGCADVAERASGRDAASTQGSGQAAERTSGRDAASTVNYFDPKEPVANMKGVLPHWRQDGVAYFVTFRLADSLPQKKLRQWQEERSLWLSEHPEPHDDAVRRDYYERFPLRFQRWLDAGYARCTLADPKAKLLVEAALQKFDEERYQLHEFVVMPNHVHVLLSPLGDHL